MLQKNACTAAAWFPASRKFHEMKIEAQGTNSNKWVEVVDILTQMYLMRNHNDNNDEFTGDHFYNIVRKKVFASFDTGKVDVYVICMDYQNHVPPQKHEEQKVRAAARARSAGMMDGKSIPRYHPKSKFGDNGVLEWNPATESFASRWAPFSMQRLLASRDLRSRMWMYIMSKFVADKVQYPFHQIVIDFDGRIVVHGNIKGQHDRYPLRAEQITSDRLAHHYGESDLKMLFWARVFHDHPVVFRTTDQDILALSLLYLERVQPERTAPLLWKYHQKQSSKSVVDLRLLLQLMHRHLKWSAQEFVLGCVLCGTDYFKKKTLFNQVSAKVILYGVQQARAPVTGLMRIVDLQQPVPDGKHRRSCRELTGLMFESMQPTDVEVERAYPYVERVVRFIYDACLHTVQIVDDPNEETLDPQSRNELDTEDDSIVPQLDELRNDRKVAKWKSRVIPEPDEILAQTRMILWHMRYWDVAPCLSRAITEVGLMNMLSVE